MWLAVLGRCQDTNIYLLSFNKSHSISYKILDTTNIISGYQTLTNVVYTFSNLMSYQLQWSVDLKQWYILENYKAVDYFGNIRGNMYNPNAYHKELPGWTSFTTTNNHNTYVVTGLLNYLPDFEATWANSTNYGKGYVNLLVTRSNIQYRLTGLDMDVLDTSWPLYGKTGYNDHRFFRLMETTNLWCEYLTISTNVLTLRVNP